MIKISATRRKVDKMIEGIFITIGVILVIASRFLYSTYDITLVGDNNNDSI